MTGDGDQFSAQLLTENPCLGIALHAGQRTATHRAVYMDVAIGEKFRPWADRGDHYKVSEDLRRDPLWGAGVQVSLSGDVLNIIRL